MHPATARQLVGIAAVAAVAGAALVVASPEAVFARADALAATPLLAAVVVLGLYLVRPLLAWPISALSILLGYVYGPAIVPVALLGAVVTTLPPYAVARYFDHDAGLLGRVGTIGEGIRTTTGDFRGIVAVRLAPLPTDPVSYGAGVAGVRLGPYVAGTAVGEAPWVATAVLVGASAGHLTTQGLAAHPILLVGALAAAVLVLAGPVYRHVTDGPQLSVRT